MKLENVVLFYSPDAQPVGFILVNLRILPDAGQVLDRVPRLSATVVP